MIRRIGCFPTRRGRRGLCDAPRKESIILQHERWLMKNDWLNKILFAGLISFAACTAGAATEQDLIAVLQSNAGVVEKCAACQQLRICGTTQSVAALAAVLGDERVGQAARY